MTHGLVSVASAVLLAAPPRVAADTLEVSIHPTTDTDDQQETTPTLGFDGLSKVVVYTHVPNGSLLGDIHYQRVTTTGVPMGSSERISPLATDDRLNDTDGPYIVYTALDPGDLSSGVIKLYDISNGSTNDLTHAPDTVGEARIHGDVVAWVQGPEGASRIEMIDFSWPLLNAIALSGPNPAVAVAVGSRYVVWEENDGISANVVAYDLWTGNDIPVAVRADRDEQAPATSGDFVVWVEDLGGATSIWARNVTAGSAAFVVANPAGALVQKPSIDGDLIGYESNVRDGNFDVYLYRISTGETFRVTDGEGDEILNSVSGNLVAFVDLSGDLDVHIAHFTFIPDPVDPCASLGGDADGDQVCDDLDNCPSQANPGQGDSDGDGQGDACDPCPADAANDADADGLCLGEDNCPFALNPDQADADGDGIGDACDADELQCAAANALLADLDAGHIRTVAGSAGLGWSGDGGPATEAALNLPHDVFVDHAGNLYIGDSGNHRVRRVDGQTGVITTVAGSGSAGNTGDGGAATDAELNDPRWVTVDAAGNLFISDVAAGRIRRVDAAGIITTVAGGAAPGGAGEGVPATSVDLLVPSGIAFDPAGNLFVVEVARNRVRRISAGADGLVRGDPDEVITTVAGSGLQGFGGDGGAALNARLSAPEDLAFDAHGNLFIADRLNQRARKVLAGSDGEVTGAGDELISTVAGGGAASGDGAFAVDAALVLPRGIAVDRAGNVFISDAAAFRVRRVDATSGIITTAAGGGTAAGDDILATTAALTTTRGIATDRDGNLYLAQLAGRIRAVRLAARGATDETVPSTSSSQDPPALDGWNRSPVTVTLSAADGPDGCGVAEIRYSVNGGPETVVIGASAAVRVEAEGITTITYFAVDAAGNAEAPLTYVVRIDLTPPTVALTQPRDGAVFVLHQPVVVDYACSDSLSGGASCTGPLAAGATLDTSAVGSHAFTVTALDRAGNQATVTHHYAVHYAFEGFFRPLVNLPLTNRGPAGRTFPVRFAIRDAHGRPVPDPAAIPEIMAAPASCGTAAADVAGEETSLDIGGLKYHPDSGTWHFNWKTHKGQVGCWTVAVRLADGTVHAIGFELR
jgi:sugar lactone lactonase YvrE